MDTTQKIQEDQYDLPYHWFMKSDEYRGRKYFGYTALAIKVAKSHGLDLENARILDAGSGDGRFIKMLHDVQSHNVEGLDYSDRAIAFSKILLPDTKMVVGDLTKFESLSEYGQYDCVFMIETLEHIEVADVNIVLENLQKILRPGGLVIITVPSTQLPMHDKHYQHFTQISLEEYVARQFTVLETAGYASVKYPLLKLLYKVIHNRIWTVIPLMKCFNTYIYPKYLLRTKPDEGEGLLIIAKK